MKKQTHLVADFKRLSSAIAASVRPHYFLVGVVRERPAADAQSRRSSVFAMSLRAVHEPPLQRNRDAFKFPFPYGKGLGVRSADPQKQTHLMPDSKGFSVFWLPFPQGKGPGVRSRGASVGALPLSPVCHAGREAKSDQRAIHPLSLAREGTPDSERGHSNPRTCASKWKKQSQKTEGSIQDSSTRLSASPLSHSERGWPARDSRWLRCEARDGRVRGGTPRRKASSKSQKQTHLMPGLEGFSSRTPAQSRRSSSLAISLRAVREPPLRGDPDAFQFPFPTKLSAFILSLSIPMERVRRPRRGEVGKGLGVRSAPSRIASRRSFASLRMTDKECGRPENQVCCYYPLRVI